MADDPVVEVVKEPSIEEQLAAIDREEAEERARAVEAANLQRIARHRLTPKYEAQTKGKEGETFAIVESRGRFIVLGKPESVRWKHFKSTEMREPDVEAFIKPCVLEPEWDRVVAIIEDLDGMRDALLRPLAAMVGFNLEERGKK